MSKQDTLARLRAQMAAMETGAAAEDSLFGEGAGKPCMRGDGHMRSSDVIARGVVRGDVVAEKKSNRRETGAVARSGSRGAVGAGEPADAGDEAGEAFAKIVRLVNASDRSERSIRERLVRSGFEEAAIEEAVERARRCRFIDDTRFADVLVRSRLAQGRGIAGIERELSEHGIDAYSLDGWPEEYTADYPDERQRALAYLDAHPTRSKNLREGAYRKLVSKGFSTSEASSAAREWAESLADA